MLNVPGVPKPASHYLLIALGSAGDVYPFLAIGRFLRTQGFRVTCAASPYFKQRVEALGLDFSPLGTMDDYLRALDSTEMWHPRKGLAFVIKEGFNPAIRPVYELIAREDLSSTKVIASTFAFGARLAQEKLGARLVTVHLQPSALWSTERPAVAPGSVNLARLPRPWRHWCLTAIERLLLDRMFGPGINAFGREIGLPGKASAILSRWVHSPLKTLGLFPAWYAPPASDWPSSVRLTGFVSYDGEASEVPAELTTFLQEGDAPLVFTPGTAMGSAPEFFVAASKAARLLKKRAILLSAPMANKIDRTGLDASMRVVAYAPLGKILPHACALIHHGGIGTAAQALAAGIPQLIRPFNFDQPDNASHLKQLGVASVLSGSAFNADAIAATLKNLLRSPQIAANCKKWAAEVDFSQALTETCREIIEA